jgi:elongation factor G
VTGRASFEVVSALPEGQLAPEFLQALETGVVEAAQSGILGGYQVIDWNVTLLEAEQDRTDSSELAFENAGRIAFYEAMAAAGPILLQPIMDVEVVTLDEYFGAVMADLNSRNAVIRETQVRGSHRVIAAHVPLAQMFGYITKLRSLSQGRATSTMSPAYYAAVPAEEMKALVGG